MRAGFCPLIKLSRFDRNTERYWKRLKKSAQNDSLLNLSKNQSGDDLSVVKPVTYWSVWLTMNRTCCALWLILKCLLPITRVKMTFVRRRCIRRSRAVFVVWMGHGCVGIYRLAAARGECVFGAFFWSETAWFLFCWEGLRWVVTNNIGFNRRKPVVV